MNLQEPKTVNDQQFINSVKKLPFDLQLKIIKENHIGDMILEDDPRAAYNLKKQGFPMPKPQKLQMGIFGNRKKGAWQTDPYHWDMVKDQGFHPLYPVYRLYPDTKLEDYYLFRRKNSRNLPSWDNKIPDDLFPETTWDPNDQEYYHLASEQGGGRNKKRRLRTRKKTKRRSRKQKK